MYARADVVLRIVLAAALSVTAWVAFEAWANHGWTMMIGSWTLLLLVPVVAGLVAAAPEFRPMQIMLGAVAAALAGPPAFFAAHWHEVSYEHDTAYVILSAALVTAVSLAAGTAIAGIAASLRSASLSGRESAHG